MQIAKYISQLLYSHDCVVVPNLGGFIANYQSAKIHPINHTFYPPSKSILFNPKLIQDDGILIHKIAFTEGISYEEVKRNLEDLVQQISLQLNQNERIFLKEIGTLYKDREDTIQFDPEESNNYLNDSFGLPTFISPPVMHETVKRRLEKKFSDRKPVPYHDRKKRKTYLAYLAIIPILLLVTWIIFSDNFSPKEVQHSGVVTLNDSDNAKSNVNSGKEVPNNSATKEAPPLKDLDFKESTIAEDNKISNAEPNPTEESQTIIRVPKYYIIGGAFQYKDNAENLISTLRNKGYEAEAAGQNPRGLYMVCYYNTEDKSEALVNLAIIRRDDNPAAWLLKK